MTKEELIQMLKTDVARFNEYRQQNPNQERWDWRSVALRGLKLKGADLRRLDLTGADLAGADLREALFGGSVLRDVVFKGADLTEANFHHAQMQGADFRGARFSSRTAWGRLCVNLASFEQVRWDKAFLEEVLQTLEQNRDWHIKYEISPK